MPFYFPCPRGLPCVKLQISFIECSSIDIMVLFDVLAWKFEKVSSPYKKIKKFYMKHRLSFSDMGK